MNEIELALTNLDDAGYRELVARADGPELDALLAGVQMKGRKLVANKTFGKGARGAKKLALEARLREVIGLAGERSSVAHELLQTTALTLQGGGKGAELDLRGLTHWTALRTLEVEDGGRVSGLDSLAQLTQLRLTADEIDLRELAPLTGCALYLTAAVMHHPESLADGPVFASLGLRTRPPFPAVRAREARFSTLVDVEELGPIVGDIEILGIYSEYGKRVRLGRIAHLQQLDCFNFTSIVADEPPRELLSADLNITPSLDFLRDWPIVELSLGSPVPDLAPLPRTIRRLRLGARDAAERILTAPALDLEHLVLDAYGGPGRAVYADLKSAVARYPGLRSLGVRGYNLESLFELPDLAELEELDLTGCSGFLELAHVETRYPALKRLIVTGTCLRAKDLAGLTRVEVVR